MSEKTECRKVDYPEFFRRYYIIDILELGKEYPDRKTLNIDYLALYNFDNEAGKWILDHPDRELRALTNALRMHDLPDSDEENLPDGNMTEADVSIRGLPEGRNIPIHKIGHNYANKLISIEGRITGIAKKESKLVMAAFRCKRCGNITYISQPDDKYVEPFECEDDICKRKNCFELLLDESVYEDQQKIGFQDLNESAKPGQPIRDIIVVLKRPGLIEQIPAMGAQCIITGILRLQRKKDSSIFQTYFEAIHIEPKDAELDMSVSEAEKKEYRELATKEHIMKILINSTAPEILGYEYIKAAQLCTIVSGSANSKPIRENIHMVVCGDPGTGKTVMSKTPRALVPRAQYSAGRGSSVAGLTVAMARDELTGGGWMAQAGALVLADRGLMILDECDKLEKEDFQALNTALEEGTIYVNKVGINQTFNARCSMIALCNPKNVRFDDNEPIAKQVKIPMDTLSRFDMVFKVLDKPEPKRDRDIAEHIAKQWLKKKTDKCPPEGDRLSQEQLSKYLQYAKTFDPEISDEASNKLVEYYLTLRIVDESETIAATARQLNGLHRLTKSIAKLRLSNICNVDDAEKAIWIHKASMEAFIDPKTGKIDIDLLSGSTKSQRDRIRQIILIIRDLQGSNGNSDLASFDNIVSVGKTKGFSYDQIQSDLKHLKREDEIIEIKDGYFRVM